MVDSKISIRVDEDIENRIDKTAAARGITRSDWMREAAQITLELEDLGTKQALNLIKKAGEIERLSQSIAETRSICDDLKEAIADLSRTIAIERAADRFMHEQILRMAVRGAFAAMGIATKTGVSDSRKELSDAADDAFREGIEFVSNGMKQARDDMAQTLVMGPTS